MLYTEIIKKSLVERYDDFNQLQSSMFKRIMDKIGNKREKDSGQLDATMQAGLNHVIDKFKNGYQKGDEMWLWIDNHDQPFTETWGYTIMRNGEPTKWEIVGRS